MIKAGWTPSIPTRHRRECAALTGSSRSCAVAERPVRIASFFETAGRSYGTQRFVGTTEAEQWDNEYDSNRRSEFPCGYSNLGFTPHLHPQLNCGDLTDIRLHRFDRESSRPRGLAGTDFQLPREGHWDYHDGPWVQTVLNASCSPQLLADAACYEVLHPTNDAKGRKRPTELHLVLLCELQPA